MNKILVAYFSASGTTGKIAKTLAEATGADIFEICPQKPYTKSDLNWMDRKSRSSVEMNDPASRPEIASLCQEIGSYSRIYLGFPIWWYVAPRIINTFLEAHELSGKTVVTFASSGGSGMGKTLETLAPSCPGARLIEGRVFRKNVKAQELCDWAGSIV